MENENNSNEECGGDFESLAAAIPDIVYRIDEDGKFTYLNHAIRTLGYESQELIGKHFSELISPADVKAISRKYVLSQYVGQITGDKNAPKLFDERRSDVRKTSGLEVRLVHKGGKKVLQGSIENIGQGYVTCEVSSSGVYQTVTGTNAKVFIGTVGVLKDMTGHRWMEAELMKYSERLEELVTNRTDELTRTNKQFQKVITELKENENLLNVILDNSPIGIYIVYDSKFQYVNSSFARTLSCSREQLLGKNPLDLVLAEDRDSVRLNAIQMLKAGLSYSYEYRVLDTDGEIRWLMETVISIQYRGERATLGNFVDITEHKRAEEILKERERRLREAQALGKIGNWEVDLTTKKVTWSDEMFKLSERDISASQPSFEEVNQIYLPRGGLAPNNPEFIHAFENGEEIRQDITAYLPSGKAAFFHFSAAPAKDKTRGVTKLIGTVQDITEHRKSEMQIREQKALTDRVLASTPNAVAVVGQDRRVIMANEAFAHTFEVEQSKAIGEEVGSIIPIPRLVDIISRVLVSGESRFQVEFRNKQRAREIVLVGDIISMQKNEVLVVLRDVTEEREIRERLYLTDRLASVGEMAAGIAHEINNPLTSVVALSQLLLEDNVPDEMKEDLEAISSEGQRAAAVVKNLLSFARSHTISKQSIDLNGIIREVLNLRAYEHRVSNVEVTTHFAPELPEIMADRFQMQQVCLNIVLNAEQAMIESHGRGNLTITTELVDGIIRISFADDGPGISPEIMNRIFDPFFTTKDVGKGTGLGLSICYGIVTNQGGRIYAQSQEGKGATFIIELPLNAR